MLGNSDALPVSCRWSKLQVAEGTRSRYTQASVVKYSQRAGNSVWWEQISLGGQLAFDVRKKQAGEEGSAG